MNIYGLPGSGKTFFASFIAQFYPRVLSNIRIKKNWKQFTKDITTIDDLFAFPFDERKWLVIIDEWGVNNNARRSMSEWNLEMWKLAMLWRKLNCDIIMIAQLERMNDSYFRELATYSFECESHYCKPPRGQTGAYLQFNISVKNRFWTIIKKIEIDLIASAKKMDYEYSTLDTSVIDRKKRTRIEPEDVFAC